VLRVCFDAYIEDVRGYMISWEGLRDILDERLRELIDAERIQLKKEGPYPVNSSEIRKMNTISSYRKAIETISAIRVDPKSSGSAAIPPFAQKLASEILKSANIELEESSDLYNRFCEATLEMYLGFTEHRIALNDEARSFNVVQSLPIVTPPSVTSMKDDITPLSEVAEKYCKEMVAGKNWSVKTESEMRYAYSLLAKITNDMPITSFDDHTAQFFKETLQKLPSNMNKKPLYRTKTIKELVATKIPQEDLLSITKINALIGRVSQLFKWASKNSYAKSNPFAGIGIKQKKGVKDKPRVPFEDSDLITLFSTSLFQKGTILHPHYYWLPLLGLYTGARLNELCQLYLTDIYKKDGFWVFDINDNDDKKLKNEPSRRVFPIHSRLIALGLLDYVETLRVLGQPRLFPELKRTVDGYSRDASKWFGRYRHACGVTDDRKPFHSFRHTVLNFLKQKKIIPAMIMGVSGHKDETMATGHYGDPYELSVLAPVVETLEFPIEVNKFDFSKVIRKPVKKSSKKTV
jgi:integrase